MSQAVKAMPTGPRRLVRRGRIGAYPRTGLAPVPLGLSVAVAVAAAVAVALAGVAVAVAVTLPVAVTLAVAVFVRGLLVGRARGRSGRSGGARRRRSLVHGNRGTPLPRVPALGLRLLRVWGRHA